MAHKRVMMIVFVVDVIAATAAAAAAVKPVYSHCTETLWIRSRVMGRRERAGAGGSGREGMPMAKNVSTHPTDTIYRIVDETMAKSHP